MRFRVLILAFFVLAGCAPRVQTSHTQSETFDDSQVANLEALEELAGRDAESSAELPVLPVTVVTPPPTPAELGEGEIDRTTFAEFIEEGPPQVFQALHLAPVLRNNVFTGFRIESIATASGPISDCGLRIGDIVTAVNGRDISRVDSFLAVWESMSSAEQLQVDIIRGGDARTLAWHIQ